MAEIGHMIRSFESFCEYLTCFCTQTVEQILHNDSTRLWPACDLELINIIPLLSCKPTSSFELGVFWRVTDFVSYNSCQTFVNMITCYEYLLYVPICYRSQPANMPWVDTFTSLRVWLVYQLWYLKIAHFAWHFPYRSLCSNDSMPNRLIMIVEKCPHETAHCLQFVMFQ